MTSPKVRARSGEKRSLTHVGGPTEIRGDAVVGRALAAALDVSSSVAGEEAEDAARAHVHGFHTYAARLHPETARTLVHALSAPGDVILDPFCGSGTVLVEARLAGRKAIGVDANPLAVRLASLKVSASSPALRAAILEGAARVGAVADARRKAKAGATRRYPPIDAEAFAPHVLLELDGLRVGLEAEREPAVRAALHLVFSSILVKLSRKAGDTSDRAREPRIAAGWPSRLFVRKAEELCRRLEEIEAAIGRGPLARVLEGDARELDGVPPGSIDLVISSPPYPGVYDYAAQHALRLRWLGLKSERLERDEIGARRHARTAGPEASVETYRDDMGRVLTAIGRRLRRGGRVVLVVADGAYGARVVRVDRLIGDLAEPCGLARLAIASQERPHFHDATAPSFRDHPRREHALALERSR